MKLRYSLGFSLSHTVLSIDELLMRCASMQEDALLCQFSLSSYRLECAFDGWGVMCSAFAKKLAQSVQGRYNDYYLLVASIHQPKDVEYYQIERAWNNAWLYRGNTITLHDKLKNALACITKSADIVYVYLEHAASYDGNKVLGGLYDHETD